MEQAKAQFAGWCTVSSPLVLGFDMANETEYDRWFPLLSNPRALAIQAAWAGSAGKLVASGGNFTTIVPHGCSCEAMSDVKALPEWTVWSKPLAAAGTSVAALVINTRQDKPASVSVPLAALGVQGAAARDQRAAQLLRLRGAIATRMAPLLMHDVRRMLDGPSVRRNALDGRLRQAGQVPGVPLDLAEIYGLALALGRPIFTIFTTGGIVVPLLPPCTVGLSYMKLRQTALWVMLEDGHAQAVVH